MKITRYALFLDRFEIQAAIGIHEFERKQRQRVAISIEIEIDQEQMPGRDDIVDAPDYDWIRLEIARLVGSRHFDLQETLARAILDIVASLVWSDESSLLTVDEGGQTMTVRAARGERADEIIGQGMLPLGGDSIAACALRARTGLIASDAAGGGEPPHSRSRMAIPLVVADELIGVLMMESRTPDLYTEESVMMLHLVASQAATIYREMTSLRNLTRYTDNILRSIAAGVITVDKHGYVVTWNKRAEEIVNLRASQVIDLSRGLTMRALIGTPRKTLLKDAEEAADLVLLPQRGNATPDG